MQKRLKTVRRIFGGSALACIIGLGLVYTSDPGISNNAKMLQTAFVCCSLSVAVCSSFWWVLIISYDLRDKIFSKLDDTFYGKIKKIYYPK